MFNRFIERNLPTTHLSLVNENRIVVLPIKLRGLLQERWSQPPSGNFLRQSLSVSEDQLRVPGTPGPRVTSQNKI